MPGSGAAMLVLVGLRVGCQTTLYLSGGRPAATRIALFDVVDIVVSRRLDELVLVECAVAKSLNNEALTNTYNWRESIETLS